MKPIGVIILNWNGEKLLKQFLPSVCANTNNELADVIVADNGSTDGSLQLLSSQFPDVKLITLDHNYGFAEGYNRAIAIAGYEYTILLNSDVEPAPNWIEPLYNCIRIPGVAACQPKILSFRNRNSFEHAGACGGYIDSMGYPYCRGRLFDTVEQDKGQYDTEAEIFWASGAAFMTRSDIYTELGGLDAKFFAHMEEIDLCWRMHLAGYKVMVQPQSTVYHVGGASLDAANPKKTYLNFRNNLLMMYKNMPLKAGKSKLFVRRLYDTAAMIKFLLSGKIAHVKAIWKAHNDFRNMKKQYNPDSKVNMLDSFSGAKNRNITFQYFLQNHKTYDSLK